MSFTVSVPPYDSFEAASRDVLAQLHKLIDFELWMMTRTEGDNWIVLHASLSWFEDTFKAKALCLLLTESSAQKTLPQKRIFRAE